MVSIAVENKTMAGMLLAIGSAQFMTMMMIGEAIAPGYSMHDNAISDLGTIDETRLLFNASLFAIGLMNLVAGYFFFKVHEDRRLLIAFAIGGIGAMGAGLIPLDSTLGIHGLFALLAFLFINLEAIMSARLAENPLRSVSIIAGVVGLIFLVVMVLVDSGSIDPSGSIGHGGTERMIAFPGLIWMMIFGGYLLASPSVPARK